MIYSFRDDAAIQINILRWTAVTYNILIMSPFIKTCMLAIASHLKEKLFWKLFHHQKNINRYIKIQVLRPF